MHTNPEQQFRGNHVIGQYPKEAAELDARLRKLKGDAHHPIP